MLYYWKIVLPCVQISHSQQNELVGCIVMAKYNHLTYRVDSIRTDLSPLSTFNYRGEQTTYVDYYRNVSPGVRQTNYTFYLIKEL